MTPSLRLLVVLLSDVILGVTSVDMQSGIRLSVVAPLLVLGFYLAGGQRSQWRHQSAANDVTY